MSPEQKAAFDAILGMAHRVGMKIAELPKEQRAAALETARRILMETAVEQGIKDPKLLEICSDGIAVVVREIESSGNSDGGHA